MNRIVFFLVFMIAQQDCVAQYTVTKIIGQVKNKTTGEQLKPGSKLKDDDLLEFSSPNDMMRVIVSGKGIYIISPSPVKNNQQSFIVEILKSALKIKSREGYLSGRSEDSDFVPAAFETESSVNNHILICPENKYLFDPGKYDLSGGGRFFLQTEYESGGKPQVHPLRTIGDTLIISLHDFSDQENTGKPNYKLGFYNKEKNSSESLAPIRPYLDSINEMEQIMKLIIAENKKNDKASLQKTCYAEVYEALGKPSDINFKTAFKRLTAGFN